MSNRKFNTDGSYKIDRSTKKSLWVILIIICTVIGIIFWLIYKLIEAIVHAIANQKQQKQNKPIVV